MTQVNKSLLGLTLDIERDAKSVLHLRVLGIDDRRLLPYSQSFTILALLFQMHGLVDQLVQLYRWNLDILNSLAGSVDELGQVHRAIGRSGAVDKDGGTGVAFLVEMGQIHLRVGRTGLRREDQPSPIGREAVPGVHQRCVSAQTPRLS